MTLGSTPKTTGKIERNYLISNENSSFTFKKLGQNYSSFDWRKVKKYGPHYNLEYPTIQQYSTIIQDGAEKISGSGI